MMRKYWYLIALVLPALIINENVVRWALAVRVGGHSVGSGLTDAFKSFSIPAYLLSSGLRLIPYACLGTILVTISETRYRDYVPSVLSGGLIGILAMIVWGLWMALRPFYTDEHVSSTTAIAFVIIPIYAVGTGAIGAVLSASLYTPFRYVIMRRGQNHRVQAAAADRSEAEVGHEE